MTNQGLLRKSVIAAVLLAVAGMAVTALAGDNPVAIATRAYELRMAGQVEEALDLLAEGLAADPQAGVLHYELARTKLFLLDFAGMVQEAQASVHHSPDNQEFRYFAALTAAYALIDAAHHQDQDKMKKMGQSVLDQLQAILQADPENHEARFFLIQQWVEMAPQVGLEVGDVEQNVALLEAKEPVLGAKARGLLVEEKDQKKIWKKILADYPEDCHALVEAAQGLMAVGELDQAEHCLKNAIAKDRQACYELLGLGLAHAMREDWDRALELTQEYLDSEPPIALKAYALGRMGMIMHRKGDADGGRELMEKARALDPHVWQTVMPPPKEIFTPI